MKNDDLNEKVRETLFVVILVSIAVILIELGSLLWTHIAG